MALTNERKEEKGSKNQRPNGWQMAPKTAIRSLNWLASPTWEAKAKTSRPLPLKVCNKPKQRTRHGTMSHKQRSFWVGQLPQKVFKTWPDMGKRAGDIRSLLYHTVLFSLPVALGVACFLMKTSQLDRGRVTSLRP